MLLIVVMESILSDGHAERRLAPITWNIDHARSLVTLQYHQEPPTIEEWTAGFDAIMQAIGDPRGFRFVELIGQHAPATTFLTRKVQAIDNRQVPGAPFHWAIVASGLAAFGMGRMAEMLTEERDSIRAFRSSAAARCWLGVPEEAPTISPADRAHTLPEDRAHALAPARLAVV